MCCLPWKLCQLTPLNPNIRFGFTAFKPKPCGAVNRSAVPGLRSRIIRMDECAPRPAARGAVKKQPACPTSIPSTRGVRDLGALKRKSETALIKTDVMILPSSAP